jgi:hypothetical protein
MPPGIRNRLLHMARGLCWALSLTAAVIPAIVWHSSLMTTLPPKQPPPEFLIFGTQGQLRTEQFSSGNFESPEATELFQWDLRKTQDFYYAVQTIDRTSPILVTLH